MDRLIKENGGFWHGAHVPVRRDDELPARNLSNPFRLIALCVGSLVYRLRPDALF
jgi:hypothetical protein